MAAFWALSPFEMLTSSLQAGFLAFTVYLSAVILKTLLRGKSLLGSQWPWKMHVSQDCSGEDSTDSGEDLVSGPVLTICLEYPHSFTPLNSANSPLHMLQKKVENGLLFTPDALTALVGVLQRSVKVSHLSAW